MASTWATRLAADQGHDLRLYFTIEGVPYVFQDDDTDVPTSVESSSRPRCKGVVSIVQGESTLNLKQLRMEGGGLTVELQDDDSGTLRALFTPRRWRRNYLTGNHSAAGGSIAVYSVAWLSTYASSIIASTLYIDGESITYAGTSGGNTLTGCTRGVWGSEAQKHYGASTDGASVYLSPPTWTGRRIKLYGYFINRDGTTTTDLVQQLGTFRLEEAPRFEGDDRWTLQCSELSDEFAVRKICSGLSDVKPQSGRWPQGTLEGAATVTVGGNENYNQFAQSATVRSYALVERTGGHSTLREIVAQVPSDGVCLYNAPDLVNPPIPGGDVETIRHVCMLSDPIADTLRVLTSRTGDLTNGSYDELPGYDTTAWGEKGWRFGAGIRSSEIDALAFTALADQITAWSYPLVEEEELQDYLRDFCFRFGLYWYVTRTGKLSISTLSEKESDSVATFDDSVLVDKSKVEVIYEEDGISPRLRLECNFDPITRKFLTVMNSYDTAILRRYPNRDDVVTFRSRSIVIAEGRRGEKQYVERPASMRAEIEPVVRRDQVATQRGRVLVRSACHLTALACELGDVVTLTADVPDLEGNGSLSGRLARIVGLRPRYDDAEVDVTFQLLEPLFFIAPACVIQSQAGAVMTLRLHSATYPEASDRDHNPGDMFGVGWPVAVWDVSLAAAESGYVQSVTTTTVTLDFTPTFAIEPDVDFITLASSFHTSTGLAESASGYAITEFIFQVDSNEFAYEDAGETVSRWR